MMLFRMSSMNIVPMCPVAEHPEYEFAFSLKSLRFTLVATHPELYGALLKLETLPLLVAQHDAEDQMEGMRDCPREN